MEGLKQVEKMVSMRSNNKNLEQYPKASGRFMMDQAMGFQGFNMFASAINMGLNHLAQLRHTGGPIGSE